MPSPPETFRESSPAEGHGAKRSRFTYRHLSQLASYNASCPLRVISHVDLDCFYAQCEMIRLGTPEDQPLAVQQWQGLIAVNYPARKFGISRMCTVTEAKKLCPKLVAQHVATWKEGDDRWGYHEDAAINIATHKVSLDYYRLESRKIMDVIQSHLPPGLQRVEKAGIDEVFVDLSAQVHAILLERFPELSRPPPGDDSAATLPMPPISALDWEADALVDLADESAEVEDPDWDDVAVLIGSEIIRGLRAAVREKLKYTCSGGIASNKMLSKLGSGYTKPDRQTVIRNRAIQPFLAGFSATKIRNLGGKLGAQVCEIFGTDSVKDLLEVSVEQLKSRLGDDTGVWMWNTMRGIDHSQVNSRTQIKSMLSAKSFRPEIRSFEHGVKWLRIFSADIFSRLVEEGILENRRRPRTINLHHRQARTTRSRSSPIPQGSVLDEQALFELAKHLLSQIVLEGQVWPCNNLSLSVTGFESGITGNMGIGAFLVKGKEAEQLGSGSKELARRKIDQPPPEKRRRVHEEGIRRFFTRGEGSPDPAWALGSNDATASGNGGETLRDKRPEMGHASEKGRGASMSAILEDASWGRLEDKYQQTPIIDGVCSRCSARLEGPEAVQSHQDWHFAKDLQEEEGRVRPRFANQTLATGTAAASASTSRRSGQQSAAAPPRRPGKASKPGPEQKNKLKFG
ncbi:DNA/RNA polymerase [Thozetella sp. PMI_491]|nr:DNA/RNA polymerase [Thozetella sp. PMI_491]